MPDSDPSTILTGIRERYTRTHAPITGNSVTTLFASASDIPLLLAAVEKVLELHKPVWESYVDGDGIERGSYECAECEPPGTPDNWPCNTYRAITAELTGKEAGNAQ